MKKFYTFSVVIIQSIAAFSQTSVYYPLPSGNAYWSEVSDGYQCNCCAKYQYSISGDTLINGFTYQKITNSGRMYSSTPAGDCNFSGGYSGYIHYKGAMRNDNAAKKVYFIPFGKSTEQLLYDFNLQLFDTLAPTYINSIGTIGFNLYNIVSLVDSVLVGGVYHKRFGIALSDNLNNIYVYLIEGVGSTFGLFGSMGILWPPFEFGSVLGCLSINGLTAYPDNSVSCLFITEIINPEEKIVSGIFPNPVNEESTLHLPLNIQQADLLIIDMSGREVKSLKNLRNNSFISITDLINGIYIFRIIAEGKEISSGKLIVN